VVMMVVVPEYRGSSPRRRTAATSAAVQLDVHDGASREIIFIIIISQYYRIVPVANDVQNNNIYQIDTAILLPPNPTSTARHSILPREEDTLQ